MQRPLRLPHSLGWIGEFRAFVLRGNVMDLAVGIVIGAAFTAIVTSLVKDLLTPILGLILGGIDFSNIFITLRGPHVATLEAAKTAGAVTLNVGLFLNACISFLIVSFAIFWMIKVVNRFMASPAAADEEPAKLTPTEQTLIEIRDLLARERAPLALAPLS